LSRNERHLSLLYFDVDNFKTINDQLGHQVGDDVIKTVGRILEQTTRETDTPCRYGGDEFCVVLPDCDIENAEKIGRKFIRKFEETYPDFSISIGISSTADPMSPAEIIKKADLKMYEAKKLKGSSISY
jgi:diguanylate cyclase (GGDEF)-like protein